MVNLETAVTDGTCPEPQNKPYIFDAPASAVTALKSATVSVATEANDHGMDCGAQGLSQNLTIASQASYPIIGIGNTAAQAFAPYRVTINGQRVAIITATQVIADNLVSTWTASSTQPGVASAIDPTQLVREVQQVRRSADTVIVYVHWGTETQACPNPQQEPLAQQLIKAGADIVIGSGTHVLLGAGYLGGAYVDYGLGNLAFYDDTAPETDSGTLIVTAQGRHITGAVWRPATILDGVPQPLTGAPATAAVASWNAARSCTNLSPTPTTTLATMRGETVPFVAPGRHRRPPRPPRPTASGRGGARRRRRTGVGWIDDHQRPPATSDDEHHEQPTTTTTRRLDHARRPTDNAGEADPGRGPPAQGRSIFDQVWGCSSKASSPGAGGSGSGSPPGRWARRPSPPPGAAPCRPGAGARSAVRRDVVSSMIEPERVDQADQDGRHALRRLADLVEGAVHHAGVRRVELNQADLPAASR